MPAAPASSEVRIGSLMANRSHITNFGATLEVRTFPADMATQAAHNANMARRGIPKGQINWYFPEWMTYFGITKQTDIMERTGWSKATVSQIMNGKQDYSPKLINDACQAFHLAPHELLLRPENAMALRALRTDALRVIANSEAVPKDGTND